MLLMGGFGVKMKMSQAGKHMHGIGSLKKQSRGAGAGGWPPPESAAVG